MGWIETDDNARTDAATQASISQSGTWNVSDNRRESERWSKYFNEIGKKANK